VRWHMNRAVGSERNPDHAGGAVGALAHERATHPLAMAFLLTLAFGCGLNPPDVGTVSATQLDIPDCELELPFELHFNFIGFDDCADVLFLRCQEEGKPVSVSDGVEIQFAELSKLLSDLEAGQPVVRDVAGDGARATIYLNVSCPDSFASLEARSGSFKIEELEPRNGGRVIISGVFDLVDIRETDPEAPPVSPEVKVVIDTTLSNSWPHKVYPVCP